MPKCSNLVRLALGLSAVSLWGCGGEVGTIEYTSVTPNTPRIGETATVLFTLTDYRGLPLAGTQVKFTLVKETPGVKLLRADDTSGKSGGTVTTQLVAATRVGTVQVKACAGTQCVTSDPITFAGTSAPSGRQLTFQCGNLAGKGSGGVHAIGAYDPSRYLIAGVKLNCIAHIADRNGDGLEGASVSFLTEAGTIGPTMTSSSDVLGNAQILYKTSLPLPKETDPGVFVWNPLIDDTHTGEFLAPLWMEPYIWTQNPIGTIDANNPALNLNNLQEPRRLDPIRNRPDMVPAQQMQNNPRDNLVSMIAVTSGEEGFTDSNNNGIHDHGEPFDDLTEPFVDSNDNGTFDPDEKFIDVDGDGKWNGKNNEWDANTVIWKQERILWTGVPAEQDYPITSNTNPYKQRNLTPCVRGVQGVGGAPITVSCQGAAFVDFIVADPWWNSLAQDDDGDGCSSESTDVVKVAGGSTGFAFTYPSGRVYGFGIYDALDRKPAPMQTFPGCFPPPGNVCSPAGADCYTFSVPVNCKFTAAQEEGHHVNLHIEVPGRIFKNQP